MRAENAGHGLGPWPVRFVAAAALAAVVLAALLWYPPLAQQGHRPVAPGPFFTEGAAEGRVGLNTAGVAELTALPGIGEARAAAIVAHRAAHGPFTNVEQLLEVPGIGQKTLEGLLGLVSVEPADADAAET